MAEAPYRLVEQMSSLSGIALDALAGSKSARK